MTARCLRVHDLVSGEADPGDAHVALVDRLWPRGVRKEALRHDELSRGPAADAVEHLATIARDADLVLAYASRDTEQNHALVLAEVVTAADTGS